MVTTTLVKGMKLQEYGSSRRNGKRKRCSVPINVNSADEESRDWTDEVNFDEREDDRAIDAEGNVQIWSGSIQPHDVWFLKEGLRFEVFSIVITNQLERVDQCL